MRHYTQKLIRSVVIVLLMVGSVNSTIHYEQHGPLGTVCNELIESYSYVMNNMMTDTLQQPLRQETAFMCSLLELVRDLSDQSYRTVRSSEIARDLSDIVRLVTVLDTDSNTTRSISDGPFHKIAQIQRSDGVEAAEKDIEVGMYIGTLLRTKETGSNFVAELFDHVESYGQRKIEAVLKQFSGDARLLLSHSPIMRSAPTETREENELITRRSPIDNSDESRIYRQHAFMCNVAADACEEVEMAITEEAPFQHAKELLKSIHDLLAAMAVTYDGLSTRTQALHQNKKSMLARHFSHIVKTLASNFPESTAAAIDTSTGTRSATMFYIEKCLEQPSEAAQEFFVGQVLEKEQDRLAFLDQFYHLASTCYNRVTREVGKTMKKQTLQIFTEQCWGA